MKKRVQKKNIYLVLLNLRSAYNVGSFFRTADAIGVQKIICIGTTPTPLDRFGRERKDIAKVSTEGGRGGKGGWGGARA